MKLFTFALALLFFVSCEPAQPNKNENRNDDPKVYNCKTTIKFIGINDNGYFVSVRNFDTKNPDCWKILKDYAHERDDMQMVGVIHFIDLENFKVPTNVKMWDKNFTKKLIAQYVIRIRQFNVDVWGYGIYAEPK